MRVYYYYVLRSRLKPMQDNSGHNLPANSSHRLQLEPTLHRNSPINYSSAPLYTSAATSLPHQPTVTILTTCPLPPVQGYSSDQGGASVLHGAVNLAAVPSTKTHWFEPTASTTVSQAALDVLAQVGSLHVFHNILRADRNQRIESIKLLSSPAQPILL
jgi:hypothetical protein